MVEKEPQFFHGKLPFVEIVKDAKVREEMGRLCQEMCNAFGLQAGDHPGFLHFRANGFPGGAPVTLERSEMTNNLQFLAQRKYVVNWKADGLRYMMLIKDRDEVFMFDRQFNCFQVPNVTFPHRDDPNRHIRNTLLDGEMMVLKDGRLTYLIFDIVKFEGQPVGDGDFGFRRDCIDREIIGPRGKACHNTGESFAISATQFWSLDAVENMLADGVSESLPFEVDGLVFYPWDQKYQIGWCATLLKWKPAYLNTVDFKLVVRQQPHDGPTIGDLYVNGDKRSFGTIKVDRQLDGCDGKIVECSLEPNGEWKLLRVRHEISFPNHYAVAQNVMNGSLYPITKEFLIDFIRSKGYRRSVSKMTDE